MKDQDIVQVCAKVTRTERALLNKKAKDAGVTAQEFVQKMIGDAYIIAAPTGIADEIRKLNAWLGRVNCNINMLSKWANVHKENAFADLILFRLALINKDLSQITSFTSDLRVQGYGKRRKSKSAL